MAPSTRTRQAIVLTVGLGGLAWAGLGCPAGDDAGTHAEAVYRQTMDANPEYHKYGLSLAAGTDSPWVRQQAVEASESQNFQIALAAVRALAHDPVEESRAPLRQAFDSRPGALKLQAAIGLTRLGDADAIAFVAEQIADPAQPLPVDAVDAIAATERAREILEPSLAARMGSDNLTLRNEAYAALAAVDQAWARAMLVEGLEREHGEERAQAIASIGRSGDPALATDIERFVNTQGLVFATLEALGALGNPTSVAAVRPATGNEESLVRAYAGAALWRLGDADGAVSVLEPLLASNDAGVRRLVATQLGAVDDPRAVEMLSGLVRGDADTDVRIAALRSLNEHAGPALVPVLVEAAGAADYQVQSLALDLLAKVGGSEQVADLLPLLDSENRYVAISAAHAVLAIRGRAAA